MYQPIRITREIKFGMYVKILIAEHRARAQSTGMAVSIQPNEPWNAIKLMRTLTVACIGLCQGSQQEQYGEHTGRE